MENRLRNYTVSPDDKFSFPVMIPGGENMSDQFEFGCVTTTPGSPNSPADHLFLNGRLVPHVFPIPTTSNNHNFSYSRSTSRTSSTGSKDSLMSSRSNSTSSRSSNCSSARTSTSTDHQSNLDQLRKVSNITKRERTDRVRHVLSTNECPYGSSQKWQFIAAAPVLKHQGSRSRKVDHVLDREGSRRSKRAVSDEDGGGVRPWFGKRVLKSFVSACKECHAIKTSQTGDVSPRNLEV